MKPRANYKYMDTQMLIRLSMFQIEDQPVVSCFLLEMVLLVGAVRNNQQLHYQTRRQNIEVQQLLHVKQFGYKNCSQICDNQWMLLLSFIVITSITYYLLTIRYIMLRHSTLRCTTTLLEKKLQQNKLTLFMSILKIKLLTFSQKLQVQTS